MGMSESELAALAADLRAREKTGEIYVQNVEIIFPPQLAEEVGYQGMIVPIRRILEFLASETEPINEERARELRHIAEKYYPEDDGFSDGDDFPDIDIEELELLANGLPNSVEV